MIKPILKLFRPHAPIPNSKGNPFSGGTKYTGVGKIGDFRRKSLFIFSKQCETGQWLLWNVNRSHGCQIEWYHFQWPWVTLTRFQGHCILTSRIYQKWCVLGTKLLKNTNRKPHTIYQMVPLSMTLSDLWLRFWGHDIFDIEYLRNDTR